MAEPLRSIHGDMARPAFADTTATEWHPSPSPTVWRKRLHLVGSAEAGQVTSLVRYDPGAAFPAHDHPEGEEILVLEGVFSDEHGDWPAGTHLLNPEGFRHAPFSREGCVLFVKLRQYAGSERSYRKTDSEALPWAPSERAGIATKTLYEDGRFLESIRLERWDPGAAPGARRLVGGAEFFVLDGALADERARYGSGAWLRFPDRTRWEARASAAGCVLYAKIGAVSSLRSIPSPARVGDPS